MGIVGDKDHAIEKLLLGTCFRVPQVLFLLQNGVDAVEVTQRSAQVNRDNRLRLAGDGGAHGIVIHLKGIALDVNDNGSCPHMNNGRGRSGVRVRGHNDFIARADFKQAQNGFKRTRSA